MLGYGIIVLGRSSKLLTLAKIATVVIVSLLRQIGLFPLDCVGGCFEPLY